MHVFFFAIACIKQFFTKIARKAIWRMERVFMLPKFFTRWHKAVHARLRVMLQTARGGCGPYDDDGGHGVDDGAA